VVDDAFIEKYEIDYVAHDEESYASSGHSDVYHHVKSIGVFYYPPLHPEIFAYNRDLR
jgi:choline-phosphate cytidylyltransferase